MLLESTELQVARPWMLHNAAEHGARPTPCLHQQALQKPRCAPKKRTSINWCFFCWKKTPHDYLQEMKRSYDDIICTWFFFFCPFFLNKNLQTKSVDVKLPLYNLEFETHFFAFLPRMQSWPPRRMYKYDQVCLRKCRLRGSKNSKMYPNLEWLVLLVQFSGWYLHHNDPQQTLERGARVWFFLPLAKWAIFFGVMKPGFRKITMMNLWLLMFPFEKSMAGDFCECLIWFFCGERIHIPAWGSWEIHRNSKVSNWEWDMWSFSGGYQINLKTSFKINKCLIFSGGLAESLVEALTGSTSALYCVQGFPFGSKDVYFERSVLMTRFQHKKQRFTLLFSN